MLVHRYWTQKLNLLAQIGGFQGSFWIISVLKAFSGLFQSCLGSVWAVFSAIKGLLLVVFSGAKVDKLPRKYKFSVRNLLVLAVFDHFSAQKSRFLDFFKAVLETFTKFLRIVFGLKRSTLWFILRPKS